MFDLTTATKFNFDSSFRSSRIRILKTFKVHYQRQGGGGEGVFKPELTSRS